MDNKMIDLTYEITDKGSFCVMAAVKPIADVLQGQLKLRIRDTATRQILDEDSGSGILPFTVELSTDITYADKAGTSLQVIALFTPEEDTDPVEERLTVPIYGWDQALEIQYQYSFSELIRSDKNDVYSFKDVNFLWKAKPDFKIIGKLQNDSLSYQLSSGEGRSYSGNKKSLLNKICYPDICENVKKSGRGTPLHFIGDITFARSNDPRTKRTAHIRLDIE